MFYKEIFLMVNKMPLLKAKRQQQSTQSERKSISMLWCLKKNSKLEEETLVCYFYIIILSRINLSVPKAKCQVQGSTSKFNDSKERTARKSPVGKS
jgi:hypothetical protein